MVQQKNEVLYMGPMPLSFFFMWPWDLTPHISTLGLIIIIIITIISIVY
jgi:hypothetical protein